jgi:hypothetical protein
LDSSGSTISTTAGSVSPPSSSGVQLMTVGTAPSGAVDAVPVFSISSIVTAQIFAPASPAVTTSTTGGSIAASVTRYYEVTAVDAYGQTLGSTEVSVETGSTTSTNANTFTWSAVSGASSYNVYIGTASGTETLQSSGITTTTYTDEAASLATGSALPTSNTTGETHFLDTVGIFPGSTDNLVYDSNLTQAIASVGATWTGRTDYTPTIGTANGDFNVLNAGTDQAEWVYYGTGSAAVSLAECSSLLDVIPGTTYTVSSLINASNVTSGQPLLRVWTDPGVGTQVASGGPNAGTNAVFPLTFTVPSGITQVLVVCDSSNAVVTAGATVSWSQIQLTQTSTVQPYEPGPLWYYNVYRQDTTYGKIATVTTLAIEDTGLVQSNTSPSTVNNSQPLLSSPSAPTVTPEGTTGSTSYSYEVSAATSVKVTFPITFPLTFGGTTSGTTLINNGNFYCWPIITFTGPLTVPTVSIGQETLTLDNGNNPTISSGETVTIDTHTHSVLLNVTGTSSSTSVRAWVTNGSSFPMIPPGSQTANLSAVTGSTGSVSITFADAYWL